MRGEAMHHVGDGPVGPHVLGAAQLLADESVELGAAGPDLLPPRHGVGLHLDHHQHGEDGEHREAEPHLHRLPPQQGEDGDDEDQIGEHVDDELREEVRQRRDVAVDPFDQLAGRRRLVEPHVEVEHVIGEAGPHLVGGGPPDLLGQVGGDDGQHLVADGQQDEPDCQAQQHREIAVAGRGRGSP